MFCKNKDKISTKRNIFTFYVFYYLLTNVCVIFICNPIICFYNFVFTIYFVGEKTMLLVKCVL